MKKNNKYTKIIKGYFSNIWSIIALIALITFIILMIWNGNTTLAYIGRFIAVLTPFILGFFLAYLLNPLVKKINKLFDKIKAGKFLKIKKGISVFLTYAIIIGLIALVVIYIYPEVKSSTKELGATVKSGVNYLLNNKEEIQKSIPFVDISSTMDYLKNDLFKDFMSYGTTLVPALYSLSTSIVSLLYNIIFGVVISVYIILDSKRLAKNFQKVIYAITPKKKGQVVWDTVLKCNHIFNGFLLGKAIDSLIIGIICFLGMSIFRMPFALLLSVIVCITNMIPYFGPFIGAIPGVLIYLFIDPKIALFFALWIFVLQQFDGLYLGPKILGDLTGIKPLWVIFGITVGGAYFGVLGMFLGVPTTAVLTYLGKLLINSRLKKKKIDLE